MLPAAFSSSPVLPNEEGTPASKRQKTSRDSPESQIQISANVSSNPDQSSIPIFRGQMADGKLQKACLNCRRSKLKCEVPSTGPPCRRCQIKNAQCRFKTKAYDDDWQMSVEETITFLQKSVEQLGKSIGIIMRRLNLPEPISNEDGDNYLILQSETNHDYSTQTGASALLAQTFVHRDPLTTTSEPRFYSNDQKIKKSKTNSGINVSTCSNTSNASGSPGYNPLLEDLLGSPLSNDPLIQINTLIPDEEVVGAQDPRPDIVKKRIILPKTAEVLVDFFHARLSHFFYGFPLQLGAWPYLPQGKRVMTPLIIGVICLISSERLKEFHPLIISLTEELKDTVLEISPPLPPPVKSNLPTNPTTSALDDDQDPELDLELGIGVEEITALLLAATFLDLKNSSNITQVASWWTRSHLKTFMLPMPPPMTLGEACGLLPARRQLGLSNWLRLWLITYIVDVQQSILRCNYSRAFDPIPFCSILLSQNQDGYEHTRDQELVAHAVFSSLLHKVFLSIDSPIWNTCSPEDAIATLNDWNSKLDKWRKEYVEDSISSTLSKLLLEITYYYGKIYINQASLGPRGLHLPKIKLSMRTIVLLHPGRWKFVRDATEAARELIMIVLNDLVIGSELGLMSPFFIQMVISATAVLLMSIRDVPPALLSIPQTQIFDMVDQILSILTQAPLPDHHRTRTSATALQCGVARLKQAAGISVS